MRNYVMTSASWDLLATWAFRLAEVGPRLLAETVQKLPPDSFCGKRMPDHSTNDACTVGTTIQSLRISFTSNSVQDFKPFN